MPSSVSSASKQTVSAEYHGHSQFELPEGVDLTKGYAWFIKWDTLHYRKSEEEDWTTVEASLSVQGDMELAKRPADEWIVGSAKVSELPTELPPAFEDWVDMMSSKELHLVLWGRLKCKERQEFWDESGDSE